MSSYYVGTRLSLMSIRTVLGSKLVGIALTICIHTSSCLEAKATPSDFKHLAYKRVSHFVKLVFDQSGLFNRSFSTETYFLQIWKWFQELKLVLVHWVEMHLNPVRSGKSLPKYPEAPLSSPIVLKMELWNDFMEIVSLACWFVHCIWQRHWWESEVLNQHSTYTFWYS